MKLKDIKIQKTLKKTILLNPGPSTTTKTVKASLLQDDICHREGSFAAITRKVADDLVKIVHGKKNDYVATLFAGSGSICIDVAVGSLIPDGKKIIARENECSALRHSAPDQAYFRVHTDITLPYDELGSLTAVSGSGRTDLIRNGRFVLPGTEALNEALAEIRGAR